APIPRHALVGWMLRTDARSAVGGDGVIPARFVPQSVERMDVFKETFARVRWRNRRAVKIDILLAVVCAQANHVALVGHDVDEFAGKEHNENAQLSPEWPNEQEDDRKCDRQQCARDLVPGSERSVEPDGAKRPGCGDDGNDRAEQTTNPAAQALHLSAKVRGR